jgi:hypothetical protein
MDWSEPRPCPRQDLLFIRQKLQEALAEVEKELS